MSERQSPGEDGDTGSGGSRRRRLLGVLAVVVLVGSAGCTGLFGDELSAERLDEQPPGDEYDWDTSRDVTITILDDSYTAVYDLENESELRLYTRGFSSDNPLSFRALRYRYPNGTVINGSSDAVEVTTEGTRRVVRVPNASGMVAYTGRTGGKEFSTPVYLEGASYEVVLQPNLRTQSFLFGDVSPGGYERQIDDQSRVHVTWDEVEGGIHVRYYLQRDILLFRGLLVLLAVGGGGALLYLYRQVRELRRRREELGLDVDTDDDDIGGNGPPPGMR